MNSAWYLIKSDLFRYTGKFGIFLLIKNYLLNPGFKYMFWFRLLRSPNLVLKCFARFMHRILSIRYQIQIPKEVDIGPGLYIGHGTGIIVNSTAKIGANCNLSPFTVIGSNKGQAALIGDFVYIGPHVCIVENVKINSNSVVGAGTVVLADIPDRAVVVGNPGRVVKINSKNSYIINPFVDDL